MGLDIYLYTREQQQYMDAYSKAFEEFYGNREHQNIPESEEAEFERRWPDDGLVHVDVPSRKHGEGTLNNRRYLRSSYNSGGFNNAVPQYLGAVPVWDGITPSYYWIFEEVVLDGQYEIELTGASESVLRGARCRALQIARALRNLESPVRVSTVSHPFGKINPKSAKGALSWYHEKVTDSRYGDLADAWWMGRDGMFYGPRSPIEVVAAVSGVDALDQPAVHLIYKSPQATVEHYAVSADIVAEFCEEAMELITKDGSCFIHWSG